MATAPTVRDPSSSAPARLSSVVLLQRLEGLAAAAVAALLYARTGASWWLFAGLWLVPDLSLLGYLASPCSGARVYNAYHNYFVPAILAAGAVLFDLHGLWLPIALIWINHIGVDRALGYGLKYGEGFGWTHLGRLGKQRA
jgi:hypothetical protein